MGLGRWSSSTFTYIHLCRCLDHTSQQDDNDDDDDDDQQVGRHHHDDDLKEEEYEHQHTHEVALGPLIIKRVNAKIVIVEMMIKT